MATGRLCSGVWGATAPNCFLKRGILFLKTLRRPTRFELADLSYLFLTNKIRYPANSSYQKCPELGQNCNEIKKNWRNSWWKRSHFYWLIMTLFRLRIAIPIPTSLICDGVVPVLGSTLLFPSNSLRLAPTLSLNILWSPLSWSCYTPPPCSCSSSPTPPPWSCDWCWLPPCQHHPIVSHNCLTWLD